MIKKPHIFLKNKKALTNGQGFLFKSVNIY